MSDPQFIDILNKKNYFKVVVAGANVLLFGFAGSQISPAIKKHLHQEDAPKINILEKETEVLEKARENFFKEHKDSVPGGINPFEGVYVASSHMIRNNTEEISKINTFNNNIGSFTGLTVGIVGLLIARHVIMARSSKFTLFLANMGLAGKSVRNELQAEVSMSDKIKSIERSLTDENPELKW